MAEGDEDGNEDAPAVPSPASRRDRSREQLKAKGSRATEKQVEKKML